MWLLAVQALVALCVLHLPLSSTQDCLSKRQVLSAIQQMQKLLSAQEAARLQGMRSLKKQLTVLQSNIHTQATGHNGNANSGAPVAARRSPDWVTLSNSSFSRQPRCADTRLGSRRCACDTGFQLRDGGVCQDVDECQLFQASWQSHLCVHDCVNLPGSYRCVCPRGYLRPADQNMCTDVDECADNQHNCSRGELCVNVFGGYRCVRPECPKPRLNTSYVKTSVYQCERNLCPVNSRACRLAANSISFHYLPLQSNRTVPRVLFKMSTTHLVGESLRFAITGGRGQGVFAVRRSEWHAGELILTSPVAGPATLEVELEMSKLARKVLLGKHIFRVTVFISRYEF
ncbi:fibulin-7-like [Terrapene carolina triunguis]|uniref:fibulin-7-like n=1 Tax=Terrapene triunguis TaxID=2587831 RepID=UPI00115657CD|nr:fibulin-7-like [Terrapene carolina triunguis]